jgi:hypothetical protein
MALRSIFPWLLELSKYVTVPVMSKAARTAPQIKKYSGESLQRYQKLVAADPYNVKPSLFTKMFWQRRKTSSHSTRSATKQRPISLPAATRLQTALTYLVWSVTRDLTISDSLVRELQSLPDDFSHHHVHNLPYLNMVIEETLRLYSPVASGLPRLVPREGAELAGYWLPGGATVCSQAYSIHRDPVIYPQPERFEPSRWTHPTKAMKDAFLAFGGGSRGMF